MADAERELGIIVRAQDFASKTIAGISEKVGGLEGFAGKAKTGLLIGAGVATAGVAAAGGIIGKGVKDGIQLLTELENANAGTASALSASGLAAKISAAQVREWSNEIEAGTGAAVDDKAIQAAANTLIRFGEVGADSLKTAMQVSTDLGVSMGSTESAALALTKAMADPLNVKTIGRTIKLTKAEQDHLKSLGDLTDEEKARYTALKKTDKVAADTYAAEIRATRVERTRVALLAMLAEKTKGAAEATQGPYQRALSTLSDTMDDAKMALAKGFLPVLTRVAEKIKTFIGKPENMDRIGALGDKLAGAFDRLMGMAEKVPWQMIADTLTVAAGAAGSLVDAFLRMPDWVKAAVISGWGLNKVTGGALAGLLSGVAKGVGEFVIGQLKGAIGIQAALVNVTGPVAGIPGGAGVPGAVAGPASRIGSIAATVAKVAGAGAKAVLGAFVALPPWVQTAVLTGWGLNKLTGGAIGSLVGQLAGGLIKGVLGITAGIVNVTGPVAGLPGGGAGAVPGVAAKGAGRLGAIASGIAKVTIVGMAAGVAVALAKELADQSGAIREQGKGVVEQAKNFGNTGSEAAIVAAINSIDEQAKSPLNAMALAITNPLNGGLDALRDTRMSLVASLNTLRTATAAGDTRVAGRIDSMTAAVRAIKIAPVINVSAYPQVTIRNVSIANRIASAVDVRTGRGNAKIYEGRP